MQDPDLTHALADLRTLLFDTAGQSPLVNLPRRGSRRVLALTEKAGKTMKALRAKGSLQLGQDIKAAASDEASLILKEMLDEDQKLRDQQGLSALHLGLGIACWEESDDTYCFAPLFLQPVELNIDPDGIRIKAPQVAPEINETLLAQLGITRDQIPANLLETPKPALPPRIAGFEDRLVLGLFHQARRAMALRLDPAHNPRLLHHTTLRRLILAGQANATAPSPIDSDGPVAEGGVPHLPKDNVTSVDTFQHAIIAETRANCPELVIQGPPGTGKSQTIVNIVANAIRDQKTVLVMAEKMNAIEAVWARMKAVTSSNQILMLQGKGLDRAEIAATLGVADQPGIINLLKACPDRTRPRAILTSPEAYALHVPEDWEFDILVIDEASQRPLASAAAAIAASKQIIVCGDSQQMPPETKADGSQVTSLLTAAERAGFPVRMLEYHYRSRHPALINVANQLHYDTRLRIVPSRLPETHYGVRFHSVAGVYDPDVRTNRLEAEAVVEAVRRCIADIHSKESDKRFLNSLGIITMNEPQRELIASLLEACPEAKGLSDSEPLFIRTINDVQGEERDIVLISLTFGKRPDERLHPNLGQISAPSGNKRVNVMMTRSRCRTELFGSFDHTTWPATTNAGIEALRLHLRTAQKGPQGYAGTPVAGPLVSLGLQNNYLFDRFNQAIRVTHTLSGKREHLGMLYLTGCKSEDDEASERKQLRDAGWRIIRVPHERLDDEGFFNTEKGQELKKKMNPLSPGRWPVDEE
jgi:hypothetical protein